MAKRAATPDEFATAMQQLSAEAAKSLPVDLLTPDDEVVESEASAKQPKNG